MPGDGRIGVIDHGTTGTRFVVFDDAAQPVAEAFTQHIQQVAPPNRVEYDPVDIWTSATDAIQRGLTRAGIAADQLSALAISNQRQTTVLWDRETGEPVGNALSWQDRRTADRIARLRESQRAQIRETTGLVPDAYFTASKLEWMLDNLGAGNLREAARRGDLLFGTIDSWLIYNLTGEHVTDVTNAAQTMLFDIEELRWDPELLSMFDIPGEILPPVRPSSSAIGFGRTEADGLLSTEIPITGVLGDQQAALVGQTGFDVGDTKITYGSGNFLLQNTGEEVIRSDGELLTTIWFQSAGSAPMYALEGAVLTTGTVLEWLERIGFLDEASGVGDQLQELSDPGEVFVVPALSGLASPEWDPRVRAAILGLSRHTRAQDILRATVESIAFVTRAVAEATETASGHEPARFLVDGGAMFDDAFAQLQADLIGTPLVRPTVSQTTARGAMFAAGLGIDWWDSLEDVRALWEVGRSFDPTGEEAAINRQYANWRTVVSGLRAIHEVLT